jgi:beta-lactam-binding protein with PASTA domain
MTFKDFAWIIPFFFFLVGYAITACLISTQVIEVPSLIGRPLGEIVQLFSRHHIPLTVIAEKEDADLEPATVLAQIPAPGQTIKPYQSLSIALSTKPPQLHAPSWLGQTQQEIVKQAEQLHLRLKIYSLESTYSHGICCGQYPAPGTALEEPLVLVYVSTGLSSLRIFPDFKGSSLSDAQEFLIRYGLKGQLIPEKYNDGIVVDQRPLAGSFIDLKKPPAIYFYIGPQKSLK